MNKGELVESHKRLASYFHRTPVLTSRILNALSGADLFFKNPMRTSSKAE